MRKKYRSRSPSPRPRRRQQTNNTEAWQPPSGSPAATSVSYLRWVLLEDRCSIKAKGTNSTPDAKTVAAGRTSAGDPIHVSVRVAPLPAKSQICVHVPGGSSHRGQVIAAHGDSVLFNVGSDYFVYSAGNGAAVPPQPPSLTLLPPCYHVDAYESDSDSARYHRAPGPVQRCLDTRATGVMRRGEDDLVVGSLMINSLRARDRDGDEEEPAVVELLLLRHGEWIVKRRLRIRDGEGEVGSDLVYLWEIDKVLSIGDTGLMCFVHSPMGLLFSNVFDEVPVLRYVPFPTLEDSVRRQTSRRSSEDVSVTSDGTVKFVSVQPRCCCGSFASTDCQHSSNAFILKTWTLRMGDMAWVMDGMVDATELWALDSYKALPRIQPSYPMVSMDEPHIIFFILCERFYEREYDDPTQWLILLDTRSKMLRSVYCCGRRASLWGSTIFCPSSVSDYFNSSPSCRDGASSVSKTNIYSKPPQLVIANESLTDNNASNSKAASPEESILAALQEIPGLARQEMLKTYSILIHDRNGRRLRALLALPIMLRIGC
ncbi:unnamed protein product [Urochloa decumbens]|uniref:DUF1618 domain-containing protein n=1 Tax=Urochloa decumbens TaxID=240449 RepID=A0ABC9AQN9_9POAL